MRAYVAMVTLGIAVGVATGASLGSAGVGIGIAGMLGPVVIRRRRARDGQAAAR